MNTPSTPAATPADASGSMNSACPAVTPSPAPGSCRLCVTSKTTGTPRLADHRERAHVDDEVVVAEREAALGDEHAIVAGLAHLGDGMPHVERREELTLLDVHDAPGGGRGGEEVGLPRQKRRNLEDVDDLGHRRGLRRVVDVGQDRDAEVGLDPREHPQPLGEAGTAERVNRGPVGLVERGLEDVRDAARAGNRLDARASSSACASLSMTHGPPMKSSGAPAPIRNGPSSIACTR